MARAPQQQQENQIAVIEPPRMQMPATVTERYGLNDDTWRALTDAVFPLAKTVGAVVMALAYCEKRQLDVFARVIHIVPMKVNGKDVETIWPGIGSYRVTAHRQADFAGWDDCEFGDDKQITYKGKKATWSNGQRSGYEDVQATVTRPEWAQFFVYRMMHGQRVRLPGPKVWFDEFFAAVSAYCDVPNERWQKAPRQMLEKCAEAACLRRAYPDVFGDEPTFEEIEGRMSRDNAEVPQDEERVARPKRGDFQEGEPVQEGEFTEVEGEGKAAAAEVKAEQDGGKAESSGAAETQNRDTPQSPPDPHETWDSWEKFVVDELKKAESLKDLDDAVERHNRAYGRSPKATQDAVGEAYQMRKTDFAAAAE